MHLQFVSHAGFLVEAQSDDDHPKGGEPKRILIDPWTSSKVFNDSWALLSKAHEVDYENIDYVFVTHEHPDHFNFPTLKGISESCRKRIKILHQKHASPRLANAFKRLGFAEVIELPLYRWTRVDGVSLYCGSAGSMDSFLAIRTGNKTVLNLNDCVFREKQYRYIAREIGEVDLLFTQFSFANWVGNDRDQANAAQKKIDDIKLQREVFKPTHIVPFASFVYFCNEENSRMNAWVNSAEDISRLGIREISFMYPGDRVDVSDPVFESEKAVKNYMEDMEKVRIDPTPEKVEFEEIVRAIEERLANFKKRLLGPLRNRVAPFGIHIHDLGRSVLIDPKNGVWTEVDKSETRYTMCSQVCWYTFKHDWGTGTLNVSGMYLDEKYPEPASKFFFFQNMLSTEFMSMKSPRQMLRTLRFLWRKKWEIFYRYR